MAIGHQTQAMHSTAKMAGAMSTATKVCSYKTEQIAVQFYLKLPKF